MKYLTLDNRLLPSGSGPVCKLSSWLLSVLMQAGAKRPAESARQGLQSHAKRPAESARQGLQSHATVDDWGDEMDSDWGQETAVSDPVEADAGESAAQATGSRRLAAIPAKSVLQLSCGCHAASVGF